MEKEQFDRMVEALARLTGAPEAAARAALQDMAPRGPDHRVTAFAESLGVSEAVAGDVLADLAHVSTAPRPQSAGAELRASLRRYKAPTVSAKPVNSKPASTNRVGEARRTSLREVVR